ncbi:acyl-CoA (8-3)-desaturase-like isoform X2 [Leguminivora glycinivorella]|uniref:acyl-CoA (8-3)-desaturase-like isoform X2 n=1 Tax=Leguminivora glycinivorella TaxID=1035111 RepID=UPI00200D2AF5|nr:acyl-CoA (8-3)-desaturase-like isoform X2 [Leguminivora glycinivorella]
MLVYLLLFLVNGMVEASLVSEIVVGCTYMAGVSLDPISLAKKLARDAKDFEKCPDKSKLPQKVFTWEEVRQFDGEQGRPMYLVIDNKVYDFTTFADLHPAGPAPLKRHAGNDATAAIRAARIPSFAIDVLLNRFKVGSIDIIGGNS